MELEEGLQIRLPALEEVADVEREDAAQEHEDGEEDVGDRRPEVRGQLALVDDPDVGHRSHGPPAASVRGVRTSRRVGAFR